MNVHTKELDNSPLHLLGNPKFAIILITGTFTVLKFDLLSAMANSIAKKRI